jgi:hypothetical protein
VKGTGKVIRLDHAYFALSGDVVGKLCWADKEDFLDDPNFGVEWYGDIRYHIVLYDNANWSIGTIWCMGSSSQSIYFKGFHGLARKSDR